MNQVSGAIARWLEQKRGTDRVSAAVLAVLALGSGVVVFLLTALLIYTVLYLVCGTFVSSVLWLVLAALGLTAWFYARSEKGKPVNQELGLDPMGSWIIKDVCSFGPRLIFAGLRQIRSCEELGEMNVTACAGALACLAAQDAAIDWEELIRQCPQLPSERLRKQLSLLDGVLFFGEHASRVTLMEPFRVRLRWMLGREPGAGPTREPAPPRPEPPPRAVPVHEPEKLSAYEILGLSPSASAVEIKRAYRKRVKECHPDLFAGMDPQAQALAERWTKALNAAYATLKPRRMDASPGSTPPR